MTIQEQFNKYFQTKDEKVAEDLIKIFASSLGISTEQIVLTKETKKPLFKLKSKNKL
jgi:hypothetical protein